MLSISPEYKPIVEILEDIFGDCRMHNSYKGQIAFDCPVCSHEIKGLDHGDGKGNLEINYKRYVFKCWSCAESHDTHGSVYKLIKKYGNDKHLKRFELLKPDEVEFVVKPKKEVELPKEFVPLNNVSDGMKLTHHYRQAMSYLRKRNVTDKIIRKYNIGFAFGGHYENRIIVPSYDEARKINYFIARSYLSKTKMKYKNPDVQKETIIFNESLIDWTKKIYLVEGAFDSIFLDNSIPMLGKYISDLLFNKIYDLRCEVTIVLDGDAWDDAENLYHKMNCGKLLGKINIIKLPKDKDIADLAGDLTEYQEFKLD
jgi:DNA primase